LNAGGFVSYLVAQQQNEPMTDILSPVERSERMARIGSKDTGPELQLRQELHSRGFRYRLHLKELPGRPDIVFPARRIAIFVNGCFWHGHSCAIGHVPKSNSDFWKKKIQSNRSRDARNIRHLRALGWTVINVWECQLSSKGRAAYAYARVEKFLIRRSGSAQVAA
jgi:DNA mismatch endonuclease (patch repair protein)